MKKFSIFLFLLLMMMSSYNFSEEQAKPSEFRSRPVIKTYFLKHIDAGDVRKSLRYYFENLSAGNNNHMFTIIISPDKIAEFESLLKKIDVEKKNILFRIFTVIASNTGSGDELKNQDLKRVVTELKKVLGFSSYKLDGTSMITLKEGPKSNHLSLLTRLPDLNLMLSEIQVKGDMPGKRIIEINELRLREYKNTLIETETSLDENGYLVAGISRFGDNGDALILVINAVIK